MNEVSKSERDIIHQQLKRNSIHMLTGNGRFAAPHTIQVEDGDEILTLQAANVAIAVGTVPGLPVGHRSGSSGRAFTSDDLLRIGKLPRQMMVVGAGIIGLEYGSMLAALGVEVTLLDMRTQLLEMVDREIVDAFAFHAREMGLTFRLGEQVESIQTTPNRQAVITMKSGKRTVAECVLVSAGRRGATDGLQLEKAGLEADSRGRIAVNEHSRRRWRTSTPSATSSASRRSPDERRAGPPRRVPMFRVETRHMPTLYPFGIYAIPEISWGAD